MPLPTTLSAFYIATGFVVGLLVGITGVGGGALMTPVLLLVFGVHPALAVGTDLLYAAVTKTAGAAVHGLRGSIAWPVVGLLACGSVPGAVLTLAVMSRFGAQSLAMTGVISFVLGIALLITAVSLLFRGALVAFSLRHFGTPSPRRVAVLTVVTGAVVGVLVSLTSVGAGALGMTALLLLYPRLPTVRIVGSDIAHAVPLTLVAGAGHWVLGTIDWSLLACLLAGSVPGILLGSAVAPRIPDVLLRRIVALLLLLAGGSLVF